MWSKGHEIANVWDRTEDENDRLGFLICMLELPNLSGHRNANANAAVCNSERSPVIVPLFSSDDAFTRRV